MIRKARLFAGCMLVLTAGSALAQPRPGGRGGFADPSAVITAEIAFNRLAQAEGQWTAFRKTADKDAILFMPRVVNAASWLRSKPDPEKSVVWWPSRIFMSCDGSYAASTGSWERPDGSVGYFTTIWRRQKKGSFRWIIDHGDATATLPTQRDDDLEAKVADCARARSPGAAPDAGAPPLGGKPGKPGKVPVVLIPDPPPSNGSGESGDGSLRWQWDVRADGSRALIVEMRREGAMQTVIDNQVKAGPAS